MLEKKEAVIAAVALFGEYIKNETLATKLDLVEALENGEQIELPDGVELGILVELK